MKHTVDLYMDEKSMIKSLACKTFEFIYIFVVGEIVLLYHGKLYRKTYYYSDLISHSWLAMNVL